MGKQVPNTITDKQMADLSRRARRANPESMFSREAVARRLADQAQQKKAGLS